MRWVSPSHLCLRDSNKPAHTDCFYLVLGIVILFFFLHEPLCFLQLRGCLFQAVISSF